MSQALQIDIITIFPDFFNVLDQSLLGKAREKGLLQIAVHDLRDVTTDRHRTVDDSPYGGGAGMVMRADVWGRALDQINTRQAGTVLAIPTPTGERLTQAKAAELAGAERIVFACGRYEGIDSRVAAEYADQVWEFSIGDYVLNGGESATLVAIEAIARLVDGMVGNPESVVEESHGASGLLEYDIYTRPAKWRDHAVPQLLLGGDHAKVARWRRTNALIKTARRRPDMVRALDFAELDSTDREVLALEGIIERASLSFTSNIEAAEISQLAQALFPLACPEDMGQEAIEAYNREHLSVAAFEKILADPAIYTIAAASGGKLIGYALMLLPEAEEFPREHVLQGRLGEDSCYLSKLYLDPEYHGTGIAGALLELALAKVRAERPDLNCCGLNTSRDNNQGPIKFYRRHGFRRAGGSLVELGGVVNHDVLMLREIQHENPPFGELSGQLAQLSCDNLER